MSEDNKKKLDQTFKATLSNEAHGGYFSLSSFSARAAGVPDIVPQIIGYKNL